MMKNDSVKFGPDKGQGRLVNRALLLPVCFMLTGVLPAEAQRWRMEPAISTSASDSSPEKAEVLPEVVVSAPAPGDPKAEKAWREVEKTEKTPPGLPLLFRCDLDLQYVEVEGVGKLVNKTFLSDFLKKADKERDFAARFPIDPRALEAQVWEYDNLAKACHSMSLWRAAEANLRESGLIFKPQVWTATNALPRLLALENQLMANTNWYPTNQFKVRRWQLLRLADGPEKQFLEAAEALRRDFPKRGFSYDYLGQLIPECDEQKGRSLIQELLDGDAPQDAKDFVKVLLGQLEFKGKQVSMHFTAIDGRTVDTEKLKGKVVLISFWKPEEQLELRLEKSLYEKFHPQGLEMIGVSIGQTNQLKKLKELIKLRKAPWPQSFDGQGWDSDLVRHFPIYQMPTYFLLDRKGICREVNCQTAGFVMVAGPGAKPDPVGLVSGSNPPGRLEEEIKMLLAEP